MKPRDPLEDRVRDELGRLVGSYVPTPGLPERIEARTRERARDRARILMGATAAAVVLVAGLVVTTRGGSDHTTRIASGPPAGSSRPSTSAAGPATTIPAVQPPPSVIPAAEAPKSFLAAVGGGNEQAVVIDTATGHVARTLRAAPRGQEVWAVSVDGRTLYAPTQQASSCSRTYLAIDTASGVSSGVAFAGLSGLQLVAPGPDGQTLAYTTGCQASAADPSATHLRRPDGSTTTLATGGAAIQLSWSADATMLAVEVNTAGAGVGGLGGLGGASGLGGLQVWSIGPSSVSGPRVVAPVHQGCQLALPRFAGNGLFVTETCPAPQAASASPAVVRLLLLDPATGALRRSWTLLSAPYAMAADLAVDPTGGWALYSLDADKINGQVSLLSLAPTTAKARVILNDAFEVAWLPSPASASSAGPTSGAVPTTVPVTVAGTVPATIPPPTTPTSLWVPSCGLGAPTTPYFPNGCVRPDGSIQPPY
jgi:hypothetical protein